MNAPDANTIVARVRAERKGFILDVDLRTPGRGVTALFGPSGSGKTSILRAIAGLDRVPGARVEVNGETWQDDARGVFVDVHRRALGYVFQDAGLFPHLSVQQNLEYGQRRRPGARSIDVAQLTDLLGIGHLLDRQPGGLSGGERQRVAIARALLAGPRLLLLDEPLASLDLERKREILPYLERLHDTLEIPVVYVSHAPDEVVRLADHIVLLEAGKVVASGPLAQTLARLDVANTLGDDIGVVIDGVAAAYDPDYGMLSVDFPGGTMRVTHTAVPVGQHLRLQIHSRDISIALEKPSDTSVLNLIRVTVVDTDVASGRAHVLVRLDAGGTPLLARITRFSCDRLGLAPGRTGWAQIKAVAVVS